MDEEAVRWLSLAKKLTECGTWELKYEFCEKKDKDIPELSDAEQKADATFAVDVTVLHVFTSDIDFAHWRKKNKTDWKTADYIIQLQVK